jgi:hypothetical protein
VIAESFVYFYSIHRHRQIRNEKQAYMRAFLATFTLLVSFSASAQYYYKDIVGTRETAELIKSYKNNNVARVVLTSYDEENQLIKDFVVEQEFKAPLLRTRTRSGLTHESTLTSYINENGNVVKTSDSSAVIVTTSSYEYNPAGKLMSVNTSSRDSSGNSVQSEQHLWLYENDRISRMLRIKNKVDTTYVSFKYDERGNIIEEQSTRKKITNEPVYYYYDAQDRLTDIVQYNKRARRLLPEYLFEYSSNNQVVQKITVPSDSDNYLIWRYLYNAQGLKTKEAIYNKQKQLTGKIEYQYFFN